MPLAVGTKLGPFEILAPIGAGGMGEVYRAHDTKLKRDVAIKVLPEAFARDPERMARFQREAEVLASLNHPNIAAIYGVEERALVMELVEGESPKGPMPFDEAWKIASQIAAALEYAHDKAIVHRDLKPANIKITPEGVVKLLDFGLAKAFTNQKEASASPENSPTLTLGATEVGIILGTAVYMAPEQARGKGVDKRADIWSFGVVLYELLTGERLFSGEDAAETLAAVIHKQPDFTKAPQETRRLLEECLQKDPKQRLRDIGDAKRLVVDANGPLASGPARFGWMPWGVAAAFAIVAAIGFWAPWHGAPPAAQPVRFQILAPEKTGFDYYLSLSPDGRQLAFVAPSPSGESLLWVRTLDSFDARPVRGTEHRAGAPFWSQDSRSLAFGADGKLKKVDVSGGPPQVLCDAANVAGGIWTRDGTIVFGSTSNSGGGIWRVPAAGGVASPVTVLNASRQERNHGLPSLLPDGRHFIYLRRSNRPEYTGIYVGSLDAKPEQQGNRLVVATEFGAEYVPSSDSNMGRLLFVRDGTLMAQSFDNAKMELAGEPVPVAERVGVNGMFAMFGASTNGALVYRHGNALTTQPTWFDRQGKILGTAAEPAPHYTMAISPDGTRVAIERGDVNQNQNRDLWVIDVARGASTRFTFDPAFDSNPVWSADGTRIAFSRGTPSVGGFLYQKASSGAGKEEALLKLGPFSAPTSWSRDGRFLLYSTTDSKTKSDLWVLPLDGERKPTVYLQTEFNEYEGQFSPGPEGSPRWVAYTSDETGSPEIYVQPFPASSGGKWMVSKGGGTQPHWRRDGRELFYISGGRKVMSVDVATAPVFQAGIPKPLFDIPTAQIGISGFRWDADADGKRFLINTVPEERNSEPISVVLNWQAGLKK